MGHIPYANRMFWNKWVVERQPSYKVQLMRLENGLECEFSFNKVGYHVSEVMAQMIYSQTCKKIF
jgi:hypothetical protein